MAHKAPVVLCFHGGGTSAAIFHAQLRNVRSQICRDFDTIFVNAPYEGPAGPGVLPLFADSGPFYWWFDPEKQPDGTQDSVTSLNQKMSDVSAIFRTVIRAALAKKGRVEADVVGVLAFSQGTMVATLLLSQSSRAYEKASRKPRPFPNLAFGVLICPGYRSDIAMTIHHNRVRLPTVHLHGLSDPLLGSGRALLRAYATPGLAECLEFDGGHHIPRQQEVIAMLVSMITNALVAGVQMRMGQPIMHKIHSSGQF